MQCIDMLHAWVRSPFGTSCERKIVGPADPRKDIVQSW